MIICGKSKVKGKEASTAASQVAVVASRGGDSKQVFRGELCPLCFGELANALTEAANARIPQKQEE